MIPSIVVAEFLCEIEPEKHHAVNEFMHRRFIIPPFDTQAALRFADIWRKRRKEKVIARAEMKADFMITATAMARGANCIYSKDAGLRRFAQDYIEVRALPSVQRQMRIEEAL
jgi:predicted nucleic acid-binding protein